MLKIINDKSAILKYVNDFLKVGLGFERLVFFIMMFFILSHFSACLWYLLANLYDESLVGTWLEGNTGPDDTRLDLYAKSFYWTITTVTTVGYGDFSGTNQFERIFCIIAMLIGVSAFSFANASITSII